MVDDIKREEQDKLTETINGIDELIEQREIWLNKTKDEVGGREAEVAERRLWEEEKKYFIAVRPAPYFGRVDFIPDSAKGTNETYYIGRYHIPLDHVFSWDAPVADLYHDPASNGYVIKKPRETVTGMVTLKRYLAIQQAALIDYQDVYKLLAAHEKPVIARLDESPLTKALAQPKSNQLRDIIETIQPEQYRQIKAGLDEVLIVQGVAGSGKSEIGIHRLAYLLSPHREIELKPEDVIFFGPSHVFLTYISTVLPGLDIPRVKQRTVSDWLKSTLSHRVRWPVKDKLQEKVLNGSSRNLEGYIKAESLKGSLKMAGVIENHVRILKEQYYKNISDIVINGKIIVARDRIKNATRNSRKTHLNEIRKEIQGFVKREAHKAINDAVDRRLEKEIDNEISRFWPIVDYAKEYHILISHKEILSKAAKNKLEENEIQTIIEFGTKLGKNKPTDLPALCYLDHLLNNRQNIERNKQKRDYFSHIVLDEAQDVSPLELLVMKLHSKNDSFTILGDIAQHILPYKGIKSWKETRSLFPRQTTRMLKAPYSYRSTYEISSFARSVLKIADLKVPKPHPYKRHGEKIGFVRLKTRKESIKAIAADINKFQNQGFQTIAVLCKTAKKAVETQRGITEAGISDSVLLDKQQSSNSRVIVGSILISKGLEFDAVIIANATNKHYPLSEINNKLLYLAVTRAAHVVHIHWYGTIANVLSSPDFYSKPRRKRKKPSSK